VKKLLLHEMYVEEKMSPWYKWSTMEYQPDLHWNTDWCA